MPATLLPFPQQLSLRRYVLVHPWALLCAFLVFLLDFSNPPSLPAFAIYLLTLRYLGCTSGPSIMASTSLMFLTTNTFQAFATGILGPI